MVVVADTTPLNYLVLIQHQDLLPRLFGRVLIPPAVPAELHDPEAPKSVRLWLDRAPIWVQVQPLHSQPDKGLDYLDPGEPEAIALAQDVEAIRSVSTKPRRAKKPPAANCRLLAPSAYCAERRSST